MTTPVIWVACKCHVWPFYPGFVSGKCGACGEPCKRPMPDQECARPLTEEERDQ